MSKSKDFELGYSPDVTRPAPDSKFVKDRLIRIETRLVKYQESNVMQMDELTQTICNLTEVMQEVIYKLSEVLPDAEE